MKHSFWNPTVLLTASVALCLGFARDVGAQGFAPDEAARHMTVPAGFEVNLVASEPEIAQPVCIEFDDHGRLWVMQYLQYPNPAGLQRQRVDRYSRTVYDKVPEPPPAGPKGADRITILDNFDEHGRACSAKDFVGGLNLASGIAFGHGGVFVLQTPYLLFYPDRDRDDVPDAAPEVLLSGFGMEDAHSVANSLTWGPDGWLYGCQGSTVTANIRGIEFQQGVWRYHPLTRRFELFCEGGGNAWGLDFDENGELIYSTNLGGHRMLHGVQGGYYWKSFGKHGALHNPHAYGYFEHAPYAGFTGGHVTDGGIIYQGDSFPEEYRGKYIANDLLGHAVQWHNVERWGSTFKASYGGELLTPHDTWFAPSDLTLGPDGAVYVADWCDQRSAHPDPDADWDRSNGRVYRIQAKGAKTLAEFDLGTLPSGKLVELLGSRNDWLVRKARRLLADRRDPEVIAPLRALVFEMADHHLALEALWALDVSGGFDEKVATMLLAHADPQVRRWTVRLLGDEGQVSPLMAKQLVDLAGKEPEVTVRSQLASTARRLPAKDGLPIAQRILVRNLDAQDAYVPLLCWWAVEQNAISSRDDVLERFASPAAFQAPMVRDVILGRLMRRFAAEGTESALNACARVLASAPPNDRTQMLVALDQGLQERPADVARAASGWKPPPDLEAQLTQLWSDTTSDTALIRAAARLGRVSAYDRALALALDSRAPAEVRISMLQLLASADNPACVGPVLKLLASSPMESIQLAALDALQPFETEEISAVLIRQYASMAARVRSRTRELLLSRKPWALDFLREVDQGKIPAKEVPVDQLTRISLFQDKQLNDLVRKHWGNITGGTPGEKLAVVRRFNNDVRAGSGDKAHGRELFTKTCAVCHRLFDEGAAIGPDLTHANRSDRDFLLTSIVDPSAVIRKEFLSYIVETTDGRFLTGLIAEQTPASITLLAINNERTVLSRDKIKSLQELPVSLMPENLLQALKPQELRDLFSYLQSDKP